MSYHECPQPDSVERTAESCLIRVIDPRPRELGDFTVRRLLPFRHQRTVGPFIFFDHFGPVTLGPDQGLDVRPHPHINLATVTYLFEGTVLHRDSVGSEQLIEPGDINWMTAGRGIVHSERTPDSLRNSDHTQHGLQLWLGLPVADEETEPEFAHYPAAELPVVELRGSRAAVMIGQAYGVTSPVRTFSPTLYVDVQLDSGATVALPESPERAVYIVDGELAVDGQLFTARKLLVFRSGQSPDLRATMETRFVVIGGAPLDGERHLWWNFVSSRPLRIEEAKAAWGRGDFPSVPGEEAEVIPLPDESPRILTRDLPNGGEWMLFHNGNVIGELTWRRIDGRTIDLVHTGVRDAYRGEGWARKLVMAAVSWARKTDSRLAATCSYAAKILSEDHVSDVRA
ncbi:MAG: redox-sensitive bicupin YhaK (pirin superfamily)/predicted GNAT family acetyltransferase [Myxococcota bacterium]|jgi:redox-sensitive bicupin YhaK (pirin superfamily)/predicted GNAT family acetyltransferase